MDFNDQKRGRLTLIRDLLDRLPDTRIDDPKPELPALPGKPLKEKFGIVKPLVPFKG